MAVALACEVSTFLPEIGQTQNNTFTASPGHDDLDSAELRLTTKSHPVNSYSVRHPFSVTNRLKIVGRQVVIEGRKKRFSES